MLTNALALVLPGPDNLIYVADLTPVIYILNPVTGQTVATYPVSCTPVDIVFSGSRLFLLCAASPAVVQEFATDASGSLLLPVNTYTFTYFPATASQTKEQVLPTSLLFRDGWLYVAGSTVLALHADRASQNQRQLGVNFGSYTTGYGPDTISDLFWQCECAGGCYTVSRS